MKDIFPYQQYQQLDRFDILYGAHNPPVFPCEKCGSEDCKGKKGKCKGFGCYVLVVKIK